MKGITIQINPIYSSQYPTPAKRLFYSVLNKTYIKEKYQLEIPFWRVSLINVCKNI